MAGDIAFGEMSEEMECDFDFFKKQVAEYIG